MIDVIIPVHNGAQLIGATLDALLRQSGHGETWQRILVVDDGSEDETAEIVVGYADRGVECLHLPSRSGRASACDLGARASSAERLLFLDADCRPAHADLLLRHAALASPGTISQGRIDGSGDGFWQRLATRVADERERGAASGDWLGFTTCNLCLSRHLYETSGGFHAGYRHYGFEDRDLLLRMQAAGGKLVHDRAALVRHDVDTSVAALCRKLRAAGEHSSTEFRQRFPAAYRRMSYAHLDVHTAPAAVRFVAPLLDAMAPWCEALAERMVRSSLPGDGVRRAALRVATGLAYLRGTRRAVTS